MSRRSSGYTLNESSCVSNEQIEGMYRRSVDNKNSVSPTPQNGKQSYDPEDELNTKTSSKGEEIEAEKIKEDEDGSDDKKKKKDEKPPVVGITEVVCSLHDKFTYCGMPEPRNSVVRCHYMTSVELKKHSIFDFIILW